MRCRGRGRRPAANATGSGLFHSSGRSRFARGSRATIRCVLNAEILHLIAEQGGVLSRQQVLACGVSRDSIRRDVTAGVWVADGRSALLAPGTADTLATATRVLAINHPTLLPTGASVVSLDPGSPFAEVVSGLRLPWVAGPRDARRRWLAVTRPDVVRVRRTGIVTASDFDALVDLLRYLPRKRALQAGMVAVQRRLASVSRLRAAADDLAGYQGAPQLRQVIKSLRDDAHSKGELRLQAILRSHGITGWQANAPVWAGGRRFFLDICFPGARLDLEFDGWAHHHDPAAFQRDRARQNLLVAAGWIVLRFTWADLDDPQNVADQVLAALQARIGA